MAANATGNPDGSSEKWLHLLTRGSRCCITRRVSLRWPSAASTSFSFSYLQSVSTPGCWAGTGAAGRRCDRHEGGHPRRHPRRERRSGSDRHVRGHLNAPSASRQSWNSWWQLHLTQVRGGQAIPSGSSFCLFAFVVIFNFQRILIKTTEKCFFQFFSFFSLFLTSQMRSGVSDLEILEDSDTSPKIH